MFSFLIFPTTKKNPKAFLLKNKKKLYQSSIPKLRDGLKERRKIEMFLRLIQKKEEEDEEEKKWTFVKEEESNKALKTIIIFIRKKLQKKWNTKN